MISHAAGQAFEARGKSQVGTVKKLLLFSLFVAAALAGIALWAFYPRTYLLTEHQLQFTHVLRGSLQDAVSATGRLEPREIVAVPSEVPGIVIALLARPNDVVPAGAILAQLDDRKARLDVDEASNGVEAARAALSQAQALRKGAEFELKYQSELEKQGGFRSELDKALVQVEAAQAGVAAAQQKLHATEIALAKARQALDKTQIRMPTRGADGGDNSYLVLERQAQLGQVAGPQGAPLFLLTRGLESMEVHTQVAEGDIPRVRKGLTASFTVSAFAEADIEFRGLVKDIRPMAGSNQGAVYYDTVIDVRNQKDPTSGEWRLRPGMTASVDIIRREHRDVWKVPVAALNFQLEEAYWSAAAHEHLTEWRRRPDAADWFPLWTWDAERKRPWPVFVRVGGTNKLGEPGIKDAEVVEVLEWEPGREPAVNESPRIIIGAPPAHSPGFFDQPVNIKVS